MADEKNLEVLKVGVICPKMPTQLSKIEEEDQYCRMDLDIGLHYNSIGIYFDVIETIIILYLINLRFFGAKE